MSFWQQDYDELFQRFDFNDDGSVNYDEMLTGLRVTTSCLLRVVPGCCPNLGIHCWLLAADSCVHLNREQELLVTFCLVAEVVCVCSVIRLRGGCYMFANYSAKWTPTKIA